MEYELFTKIIDDLKPGRSRLYLQKTGESFMHPRILEMIRYIKAKRPDYELAMHSNMTYMDDEIADTVLQNVDFFSISIFGFDQESYRQAHGADDFERVLRHIDLFHKKYTEATVRPKIYFDVVRNHAINSTYSDEEIFKFLAKRYPFFNTGIHFCFNFQGFVPGYDKNDAVFENLPQEHFPQCVVPWTAFIVLWDGKVGYCMGDAREYAYMGDLNHQTIEQVWHGEKYKEFRALHAAKKWEELREKNIHCGTCNWLFSLKTQSSGNLCLLNKKNIVEPEKNYLNGIPITSEEFLESGFTYYLLGDPAKALFYFVLAESATQDRLIKEKAAEWTTYTKNILLMRRDIEHWEKALNSVGLTLRKVHVSKYKIAAEQMDKVDGQHELIGDTTTKKTDF
jgi:radical SAM protein with 4Fe4S-binding SPASM domain